MIINDIIIKCEELYNLICNFYNYFRIQNWNAYKIFIRSVPINPQVFFKMVPVVGGWWGHLLFKNLNLTLYI